MPNCGFLTERASKTDGQIGYVGEITLASVQGKIALQPVDERRKETSPDFAVWLNEGPGWFRSGSAWWKQKEPTSAKHLSINIDNDAMARPVNVAGFPPNEAEGDDPARWNIVWSRPRGGGKPAAPKRELVTDEIPY